MREKAIFDLFFVFYWKCMEMVDIGKIKVNEIDTWGNRKVHMYVSTWIHHFPLARVYVKTHPQKICQWCWPFRIAHALINQQAFSRQITLATTRQAGLVLIYTLTMIWWRVFGRPRTIQNCAVKVISHSRPLTKPNCTNNAPKLLFRSPGLTGFSRGFFRYLVLLHCTNSSSGWPGGRGGY